MKRNYYQHQARLDAKRLPSNFDKESFINGYERGFELALRSLKGVYIKDEKDLETWKDVWTKVLTDESEWDY